MFNKSRNGKGTREWSEFSYNNTEGCSHDCKYCYARITAMEKGRIPNSAAWAEERVISEKVNMEHNRRLSAVTMFPTTHDITPNILADSLTTIGNILKQENHLLIVSKPHLECIRAICDQFGEYREKILFRFTIGSMDEHVCRYFEPGAPTPLERLECLILAKRQGFHTSVSIEPMLENEIGTSEVIKKVYPFVTEDIWIGKMNSAQKRLVFPEPIKSEMLDYFRHVNSDEAVKTLYLRHRNDPKIKWKDSIKEVVRSLTPKVVYRPKAAAKEGSHE